MLQKEEFIKKPSNYRIKDIFRCYYVRIMPRAKRIEIKGTFFKRSGGDIRMKRNSRMVEGIMGKWFSYTGKNSVIKKRWYHVTPLLLASFHILIPSLYARIL